MLRNKEPVYTPTTTIKLVNKYGIQIGTKDQYNNLEDIKILMKQNEIL